MIGMDMGDVQVIGRTDELEEFSIKPIVAGEDEP
jgi:hypothetical protein